MDVKPLIVLPYNETRENILSSVQWKTRLCTTKDNTRGQQWCAHMAGTLGSPMQVLPPWGLRGLLCFAPGHLTATRQPSNHKTSNSNLRSQQTTKDFFLFDPTSLQIRISGAFPYSEHRGAFRSSIVYVLLVPGVSSAYQTVSMFHPPSSNHRSSFSWSHSCHYTLGVQV